MLSPDLILDLLEDNLPDALLKVDILSRRWAKRRRWGELERFVRLVERGERPVGKIRLPELTFQVARLGPVLYWVEIPLLQEPEGLRWFTRLDDLIKERVMPWFNDCSQYIRILSPDHASYGRRLSQEGTLSDCLKVSAEVPSDFPVYNVSVTLTRSLILEFSGLSFNEKIGFQMTFYDS